MNPTPELSDNFGIDVDIEGDQVLIGTYRDDTGARDAGAAYQYDAVSGDLLFTYTNPTPHVIDYFGFSVAISAESATIGAYWDDEAALDSGMLFQFDSGTGVSVRDIVTPGPSSFDYFGQAVATSGEHFAVGAPLDDLSGTDAGVVYVYDSDGILQQTIMNPSPEVFDQFGSALSISANMLAVGAIGSDANGISNSGVVYLFDPDDGSLLQTLVSPNASVNGGFGRSIAIEGSQVIVGAPNEDVEGTDSGAAYVFDASSGTLVSQVINPSSDDFDQFGTSVAIAGNTVAVGALADVNGIANAGVAYVLDVPTGDLISTLDNPSPAANDNFGQSIAVEGGRVLVGAPRKDVGQVDTGAAYLFDSNSGDLIAEIANPLADAGSFFGESLAISADYAIVGAFGSAGAGAQFPQAGAAWLFQSSTGAFYRDLPQPAGQSGDLFGLAVAASETDFLVGAPQVDGTSTDRGAVYVFDGDQELPPTADAGGPYTADEGSLVQLNGAASADINQTTESLTFEWDLDYDGVAFDVDAEGISPEVFFADDASVTLGLRVSDSTGLVSIATSSLVVNNVAPTLTVQSDAIEFGKQVVVRNFGTLSDVGNDSVSLSVSVGTIINNGDGTWVWRYQPADRIDGAQETVTIIAEDEDGGQTPLDFTLSTVFTLGALEPTGGVEAVGDAGVPGFSPSLEEQDETGPVDSLFADLTRWFL